MNLLTNHESCAGMSCSFEFLTGQVHPKIVCMQTLTLSESLLDRVEVDTSLTRPMSSSRKILDDDDLLAFYHVLAIQDDQLVRDDP